MNPEKEDPDGKSPPSATLAALTMAVGGLFWCGGICSFVWAELSAVQAEERISPLGRLILFAVVGAVLLVAGLYGLWRWSEQPRDGQTRASAYDNVGREPQLLQRSQEW